jgi:hypothetical protein
MIKKDRANYFLVFIMVQLTVQGYTQENASNPLAAVSNTDLRYQFYDLGDANLNEYFIDGALHRWSLYGNTQIEAQI